MTTPTTQPTNHRYAFTSRGLSRLIADLRRNAPVNRHADRAAMEQAKRKAWVAVEQYARAYQADRDEKAGREYRDYIYAPTWNDVERCMVPGLMKAEESKNGEGLFFKQYAMIADTTGNGANCRTVKVDDETGKISDEPNDDQPLADEINRYLARFAPSRCECFRVTTKHFEIHRLLMAGE